MELQNPNARGHSKDRILNYIGLYGEHIIDFCEFSEYGIDLYVADELFATSGYDKDGVPFFIFHSADTEDDELEYFSGQQKNLREKIIDFERSWIANHITLAAYNQITYAYNESMNGNPLVDFSEVPQQAIEEGFLIEMKNLNVNKNNFDNVIDLMPYLELRYCLTLEALSFIKWYKQQ